MSIIGFDVHTCKGSGRAFVVPFVSGLACSDIHPEHHCGHDHCCDGQIAAHDDTRLPSDDSLEAESCCTNDFQVLSLTGVSSEDDHRHYDECHCGHCPCVEALLSGLQDVSPKSVRSIRIPQPGSGPAVPGNAQSFLGVWRI